MSVVSIGGVLLTATVLTVGADALVVKHARQHAPPRAAVFVSPTGNDTTCQRRNPSRPCASFERAYEVARPGDVVQVAGGVYPAQKIGSDPSKAAAVCRLVYNGDGAFSSSTAGCVTFEPAPGATVTVGGRTNTTASLNMNTTSAIPVVSTATFKQTNGVYNIWLGRSKWNCTGKDATQFTGCSVTAGTLSTVLVGYDAGTSVATATGLSVSGSGLRFENMAFSTLLVNGSDVIFSRDTAAFGSWHGTNDYFNNGTLGPFHGSQPNYVSNTDHVGFLNSTVKDETITGCDGDLSGQNTNYYCHGDGFYLAKNTNLYFVADTFFGNEAFHLFFGHGGSYSNPGPVTIVNNYFGGCGPLGCSAAVSIRGDTNDTLGSYTIDGNMSTGGWLIGANSGNTNVSLTNWVISGNIFGSPMCPVKPEDWSGSYSLRFVDNIGTIECRSSAGLVATGNQTMGDVGIGGGGSLWAEARAHSLGTSFWNSR